MKKMILFVILLVFFGATTQAQTNSTDITDKFFEIFSEEPLKAMDYAFGTNPYLLENPNAIETLKNRYKEAKSVTGVYQGVEKITEKSIGNSFKLCSFLVKYERIPLRFTFVLYRAKDNWCVNQLYYDNNLQIELEASAKQDDI